MKNRGIKATRREKWNRPVSQNFYRYVRGVVKSVTYASKAIDTERMMRYVDIYLYGGDVSGVFNDMEKVVFAILKPQLDEAMERSRRARMAASRRREAKKQLIDAPTPEPSQSPMSAVSDDRHASCDQHQVLHLRMSGDVDMPRPVPTGLYAANITVTTHCLRGRHTC